jgi:RNA polymerase sigma-70 factor (ECF subfamily)
MGMVIAAGDTGETVEPGDGHRDEELAARANVDLRAFGLLYERYGKRVHRYIRARVRDDGAADDLTAQTFYRALASAESFRGEGSYRAWLFQIARNTVATWHAHRNASPETPFPVLPEEADENASPLIATLVDEERDAVRKVVDQLPEAQREVVRLRYWNDLTIDEIAETTLRQLKRHLSRKDLTILLGATGASALAAAYSYRRYKKGDV